MCVIKQKTKYCKTSPVLSVKFKMFNFRHKLIGVALPKHFNDFIVQWLSIHSLKESDLKVRPKHENNLQKSHLADDVEHKQPMNGKPKHEFQIHCQVSKWL